MHPEINPDGRLPIRRRAVRPAPAAVRIRVHRVQAAAADGRSKNERQIRPAFTHGGIF
jgi:hypothetical protein